MKRLSGQNIGISQGDEVMFSDFEDGGEMWTGKGTRERRRRVNFQGKFRDAPLVHVALSMWDFDSAHNARAEVSAEKIDETGFDMVFRTWADTRVARARIRWMAVGTVGNADDWNLY